uniref:Thioredoxin domain-containing protein 9 n=1 Tax=Ascaris lumbricoides TaxID=6252 RepID=A0A0M3IGL4_ASCLU
MASSVQEVLSEQLLKAAAVVEEQLDHQMERMDHLGEDDLEAIRRRRMQEIKKKQLEKQEWLLKGHGEYEELPDERSFFEATKKSSRFVAHFFRPSTDRCKIVDMHLKRIASQHMETRFVRVNAEKFPFLTQRLNIRVIPTICVIIDSKTVDYIRGFDDLGGTDEFKTETLEWRLARSGVIDYDGPSGLPERGGKLKKIGKSSKKTIRSKDDEDSDDDW